MVSAAVWVISATVVAGTVLAFWHLRVTEGVGRPPGWIGIAHGLGGAAGLVLLLLALRGPARGVAAGAGSFGAMAAWLFGAAAVIGAVIWVRRRRGPMVTIVVHAGVAITAWALLLAWGSLG
jgi:hypothetical protein